jgi:hypothetical protein
MWFSNKFPGVPWRIQLARETVLLMSSLWLTWVSRDWRFTDFNSCTKWPKFFTKNSQRSSRKIESAQHTYEEGHMVGWMKLRFWKVTADIGNNKESAYMACLTNMISQPRTDVSPSWIPLISNEVTNSQRWSVWYDRFFIGLYKVLVALSIQFLL